MFIRAVASIAPGMFLSRPPQHPIHALAVAGSFDRIGDHLTAHQGVLHSLGAHGDAVADGDRPNIWGASGQPSCFRPFGQIVQTDVARGDRAVAVGNAEDRLTEITVSKA